MENTKENARNFLLQYISDNVIFEITHKCVVDMLIDYANKLNKPCVSSSRCHIYVNDNISVKDYCDKNCENCSSFY